MLDLTAYQLSPIEQDIFSIFQEISAIPRGSGNMKGIADYCENFAKLYNLKYIRDNSDNVIIFKNASHGYEKAEPIILQGHLDMVCQAEDGLNKDFLNEGLEIYQDGDFIKAKGTTLGADNGIAIAYIMAILSNKNIAHPSIEAIFTTDEETGLIGAGSLDCSVLKSKQMINLDSEEDYNLTVSCAGGQDVILSLPLTKNENEGYKLTLSVKGLLGGHSGVEIGKNRTNANILLGEILFRLKESCIFNIISLNGGTKPNAITQNAVAEICIQNKDDILKLIENIKNEYRIILNTTEPNFNLEAKTYDFSKYICFDSSSTNLSINLLKESPYGVIKMSEEINGLVETSLNLGILSTEENTLTLHFSLRSNKENSLFNLTDQVKDLGKKYNCHTVETSFYPAWEYKADSPLRELYKKCYRQENSKDINVLAIHAGLECGLFSNKIANLDCISVGPNMHDVHTPNEKLEISSTVKTFKLLLKVLSECKK